MPECYHSHQSSSAHTLLMPGSPKHACPTAPLAITHSFNPSCCSIHDEHLLHLLAPCVPNFCKLTHPLQVLYSLYWLLWIPDRSVISIVVAAVSTASTHLICSLLLFFLCSEILIYLPCDFSHCACVKSPFLTSKSNSCLLLWVWTNLVNPLAHAAYLSWHVSSVLFKKEKEEAGKQSSQKGPFPQPCGPGAVTVRPWEGRQSAVADPCPCSV